MLHWNGKFLDDPSFADDRADTRRIHRRKGAGCMF